MFPKNVVSEGPDILIQYSEQLIYLEAVTPSEGSEDNKDKVPRMTLNKAMRVPDEQITLRYCSAIKDKYKKYISYMTKGTLHPPTRILSL